MAQEKTGSGAPWTPVDRMPPSDENPFAMSPYVYTVVTPDMDASLRFYRDTMGHEIIDRGELTGPLPLATAGPVGRPYVLLRHRQNPVAERGVVRLLLAAPGAKANRPRPDAKITDPGLAVFECHPRDEKVAYAAMTKAGYRTVSEPQYYFFGPESRPWNSSNTFSVFGPAGEQMFLSTQNTPDEYGVKRQVNYEGVFGPIAQHTMMCADRWPTMDFYSQVFGLKQLLDRLVFQESINTLVGAPPKTYYRFLWVGGAEIWEFRQWRPPPKPPWPTDLDRTGLAMVTMLVDNLAVVKARVVANRIPILGEGGLPTPDGRTREAFFIRGALGELLEVVGRS